MNHTFDPAAYRRLRLPWLLLSLVPSLLLDGLLLRLFLAGPMDSGLETWAVWREAFAFLALINQALLKGFPIRRYFYIKSLRQKSWVTTGEGKVVHCVVTSFMSRGRLAMAIETTLPRDGKQEYATFEIFTVLRQDDLKRTRNGSLRITGLVEEEFVNEYMQAEYGQAEAGYRRGSRQKHTVPGYYLGMDEIERALSGNAEGITAV